MKLLYKQDLQCLQAYQSGLPVIRRILLKDTPSPIKPVLSGVSKSIIIILLETNYTIFIRNVNACHYYTPYKKLPAYLSILFTKLTTSG